MPRIVSARVSNLIRARCRVKGRIARIEGLIAKAKLELEKKLERLERWRSGRLARLSQMDEQIRRLAPKLDPELISGRGRCPRPGWKYGAFNKSLVKHLKDFPTGISTTDMVLKTASDLNVALKPSTNYLRHRDHVRRQLSDWASRGYVQRLHDPDAKGIEGMWRINGESLFLSRAGRRTK